MKGWCSQANLRGLRASRSSLLALVILRNRLQRSPKPITSQRPLLVPPPPSTLRSFRTGFLAARLRRQVRCSAGLVPSLFLPTPTSVSSSLPPLAVFAASRSRQPAGPGPSTERGHLHETSTTDNLESLPRPRTDGHETGKRLGIHHPLDSSSNDMSNHHTAMSASHGRVRSTTWIDSHGAEAFPVFENRKPRHTTSDGFTPSLS